MTLADIMALPVGEWAAKDCVLLLWATDPLLEKRSRLSGPSDSLIKQLASTGQRRPQWHLATTNKVSSPV